MARGAKVGLVLRGVKWEITLICISAEKCTAASNGFWGEDKEGKASHGQVREDSGFASLKS